MSVSTDPATTHAVASRRSNDRWMLWFGGIVVVLAVAYVAYAFGVMLEPDERDECKCLACTAADTAVERASQLASASTPSKIHVGKLGQFGDSVGGVLNPVLTVCLVVVAVAAYRSERNELLKNQRLLNAQIQAAQHQDRRKLFLDLVSIQEQILQQIQISGRTGRAAVSEMLETDELARLSKSAEKMDHVKGMYIQSYRELSRYLRAVEVVLEFVLTQIHPGGSRLAELEAADRALYGMLLATFDQCDLLVFAGAHLAKLTQDAKLNEYIGRVRLFAAIDDPALREALERKLESL